MKAISPSMTNTEVQNLPALITVKQGAALAGVSPNYASAACARGEWPATKVSGRWRIATSKFLRMLGLSD